MNHQNHYYESQIVEPPVRKMYTNIVFLINIVMVITFGLFALFGVVFGLRFNTGNNDNHLSIPGKF